MPSKRKGRKEIVSWSCTEQALMRLIKARDPNGGEEWEGKPSPCLTVQYLVPSTELYQHWHDANGLHGNNSMVQ